MIPLVIQVTVSTAVKENSFGEPKLYSLTIQETASVPLEQGDLTSDHENAAFPQ
jgi:hypothetical protein